MQELYPTFRNRLAAVIGELEKRGFRPRIQDGSRSSQDQLTAFNAGNSKLKYGFHNVTWANGTTHVEPFGLTPIEAKAGKRPL